MVSESEIKKELLNGDMSKFELAEALAGDPNTINTLCYRLTKKGEIIVAKKGPRKLNIYALPEDEFLKEIRKKDLLIQLQFLMEFFNNNAKLLISNPDNRAFFKANGETFNTIKAQLIKTGLLEEEE